MAKSKAGGTRSYIRGRIASDVYSIGKDGKGKKQQVVRGLAESVANPRTEAQMRQRMIMATVSELAKGLRKVIDHSFDGIPVGQPSVSEFSRLAIAAYNEDAAKSTPEFGYLAYGQRLYAGCNIPISRGKVVDNHLIYDLSKNTNSNQYGIPGVNVYCGSLVSDGTDNVKITVQSVVTDVLGGDANALRTIVCLNSSKVYYLRISKKSQAALDTEVTSQNFSTLFDIETNGEFGLELISGSYVTVGQHPVMILKMANTSATDGVDNAWGTILSKKVNGQWKHSNANLTNSLSEGINMATGLPEDFTLQKNPNMYAVALPTYPTGSAKFLNGGEL